MWSSMPLTVRRSLSSSPTTRSISALSAGEGAGEPPMAGLTPEEGRRGPGGAAPGTGAPAFCGGRVGAAPGFVAGAPPACTTTCRGPPGPGRLTGVGLEAGAAPVLSSAVSVVVSVGAGASTALVSPLPDSVAGASALVSVSTGASAAGAGVAAGAAGAGSVVVDAAA